MMHTFISKFKKSIDNEEKRRILFSVGATPEQVHETFWDFYTCSMSSRLTKEEKEYFLSIIGSGSLTMTLHPSNLGTSDYHKYIQSEEYLKKLDTLSINPGLFTKMAMNSFDIVTPKVVNYFKKSKNQH